ncbi:MAG: PqqD family protein, partial [Anaerolineales bacterium]|nr:PqqD family protein [Anaerolineales bacterium]
MTFTNSIKSLFRQRSTVNSLPSGLFHYRHEDGEEKSRIHLRLDPDGHGTLIVNANQVMHLNPTAALMAYLILEEMSQKEIVKILRSAYSVTKEQVLTDLQSLNFQLDQLIRPDGACPVHELDLETNMPFSARPTAPYRMDLALTYRCNN